MLPDDPNAYPLSSFQSPVSIPDVEPGDTPLETIQINSVWLALLRGCAKQLLQQSTWRTDDPGDLNHAQEMAFELIDLLQDQGVPSVTLPTASVIAFAGSEIPDGFLECDGSLVSRTTYAELFDAIGTLFGSGDGSTTFALPNLGGRTVVGNGTTPEPDYNLRVLGQHGGESSHNLSTSEMPAHNHDTWETNKYTSTTPGEVAPAFNGSGVSIGFKTGVSGLGTSHNNMQPFLVLVYLIKT